MNWGCIFVANPNHYLKRSEIYGITFLSVFVSGVIIIKIVESWSWLDSIYFVIVTISTVGYGDITPTTYISKIVSIILITTGISTFALLSQEILDAIVQRRFQKSLLPENPLDYTGHVILGGYSSIGSRIGRILTERGFNVIIVDKDEDRIYEASSKNLHALIGDVSQLRTLQILSIERAKAMFLALNNDNITAKTTILAKHLNEDIPIYAEIDDPKSETILQLIDLDTGVTLPFIAAQVIRQTFFHSSYIPFFEQYSNEGSIYDYLVADPETFKNLSPTDGIALGKVSIRTKQFFPYDSTIFDISAKLDLVLTRRGFLSHNELTELTKKSISFNNLIVAGYNELSRNVIYSLEFGDKKVITICENEEEFLRSREEGFTSILWNPEDLPKIMETHFTNNDLIISNFTDLTDDLIFVSTVKRKFKHINVIEIAKYDEETDVFILAGVSAVVSPQRAIASYLVNQFLTDTGLSPSIIFANGHLFITRLADLPSKNRKLILKKGKILAVQRNGLFMREFKKLKNTDIVIVFLAD